MQSQRPRAHSHEQTDIRQRGGFIISGLTGGHGVFHWFTQSFLAMLPEVQQAFGLSGVGVGGITAVREIVSGIVTLPGGIVTDALRRHWGLVLALCMAGFGAGWLVIGFSPVYPMLLAGMAIVALSASIWHLPAVASLSHHFAHRRGTALSFHGVGGQIGDAAAPPVTGILLGVLAWNGIITIYAVVPLFLAFLVFWAFRRIGRSQDADAPAFDRAERINQTKLLIKNPILWGIMLVAGIRGMAFLAFATFLPIYLNDLGMTPLVRNLHLGLLMAVGVVSTPIFGYVSDRLSRKAVLIPGLVLLSCLSFALGDAVPGIWLACVIGLLGLFLFGDQPILTALAMDVVGRGSAATALGILSFSRFVLSAASPIIAGALYENYGPNAAFIYVACLFAAAAAILIFVPARARAAGEA